LTSGEEKLKKRPGSSCLRWSGGQEPGGQESIKRKGEAARTQENRTPGGGRSSSKRAHMCCEILDAVTEKKREGRRQLQRKSYQAVKGDLLVMKPGMQKINDRTPRTEGGTRKKG